MLKKNISTKLKISLNIIIVFNIILFFLLTFYIFKTEMNQIIDNINQHTAHFVKNIKVLFLTDQYKRESEFIQQLLNLNDDICKSIIYDYNGNIFAEYSKDSIHHSSLLSIQLPIYNKDRIIGTFYVEMCLKFIFKQILYKIMILFLILSGASIIFSGIFHHVIYNITTPINKIVNEIKNIRNNNYYKIDKSINNEFGTLIDEFNLMIDDLSAKEKIIEYHTNNLEQSIIEKTKQYNDLIENLTDCVYTLDLDLKFTYCSGKIFTMLGFNPNEIIGKSFIDIFLKQDFTSIDNIGDIKCELIGEHLETKEIKSFSFELGDIKKDDIRIGYQGILRDITDTKALESKFQYANRSLSDIIDVFPMAAIIIRKHDYKWQYNNDKFNYLKPFLFINNKKLDLQKITPDGNMFLKNEDGLIRIESKINNLWYELFFKEIIYNMKECILVIFNEIHDVKTKTIDLQRIVKNRTAQLESANKELESFAYTVSHDLAQPLRVINGKLNIINELYTDELSNDLKLEIESVINSTINMDNLITGLLTLSRAASTNMILDNYDMIDKIKSIVIEENNELVKLIHPETLFMYCDYRLMSSVFLNLIRNGIKFSQDNQEIIIEVGYDKEKEAYFVKDNGSGIDMEVKDKIFEAFQTTKHKYSGSGIGLNTVYRIILRHNGKIWIESEINKGSIFYFTLNLEKENLKLR